MNVLSKRLLSLFVAMVMVLSMVPAVSATETESTETTTPAYQAPSKTYEAEEWVEVGDGATLITKMKNNAGVNAAANAEKVMGIRLTDDITLSNETTGIKKSGTQLYIGYYKDKTSTQPAQSRAQTLVLDLNGHTLKTTSDVTLSRLFGAYGGSTFTLTNGIVEMNGTYSAYSPVVFFQGASKVTLDGVKITLNDPSARATHGGMFYISSSSSTLDVINSDLIVDGGDTGSVVKGGIVNTGAACTITLKNSNFTGGRVTGGVVSGTTHDAMGGQFYILGTAKFTAEDCTFTGGECVPAETSYKDYGGQIYKVSGSGIFKLTNCTFTGGSAERGAQIYYGGTSTSSVFENCTFTGGVSSSWGGSLYNGGRLTLNNCEFTGNHGSNGGAVFNTGSYTSTYNSCTFSGNTATTGGAMSKYGDGTVILNDVDMTGTASGNGGALIVCNGTVILNSGSIHDGVANSTANGGGNVYINRDGTSKYSYGTFIMNGGSINDGKALYGANVRIYNGRMIMNGGFVDNGVASGTGHCIQIRSSSIADQDYDDAGTVTATYKDSFYMFGGRIASVIGATDEKSEICGGKIGNDVSEVISDHITQSAEKDQYGFYTISHIDNDTTVVNTPATCTTAGSKTTTCETCTFTHNDVVYGGTFEIEIPALGHDYTTTQTKAPTCTEAGEESYVCNTCGDAGTRAVEALGHTEEIIPGKAATCTETGLTEGKVCTVCGETITAQEEIAAAGHTEVIDEAVAATCTTTGLTEGKHCSVCGEVIVAQEVTPMTGHAWNEGVVDPKPTCNGAGVKTYTCTACGETKTEAVDATGHTVVVDAAVAATCSTTGLTEGSHCSVCGEVIVAQEIVPTLPHTEVIDEAVAATCTTTGLTEGKHCSVCGEVIVAQEEIAALGHTEELIPGKAATCTDTGLTAGKVCAICGEIITAQEEIAALGHSYNGVYTEPTYEADGYTTYTCSVCGDSYVETDEGSKLENFLTGSGTQEDPYLITSLEDLILFRDTVNTYKQDGSNQFYQKYVRLETDIDLAGINWEPIGVNEKNDHNAFLGTFDGNGHTIYNLYVEKAGSNLGFFAYTAHYDESRTGTYIKNLTFENITVKSTNSGTHVGGVIGNAGAWTYVENVKVTGTVDIEGRAYVGGIVGHGYPKINNCHMLADGEVTCTYWACGGIVGYAGEGGTRITNSSVVAPNKLTVTTVAGGAAAVCGLSISSNYFENLHAENVDVVSLGNGYNPDYCLGYVVGNGEENCTTTNLTAKNVKILAGSNAGTSTDGDVTVMLPPNATVTEQEAMALLPGEYMVWPSGDETVIRPLEIVVNFKADDTLEDCLNGGYSDWLVDFNLTLTGMENGTIVADNCYLAGNYGSFDWVVIPTDGLELKDGVTYPVVAAYDASLNYKDICNSVKNFTAAIHIDQAILDANPNLQVELDLVMTNPADAADKLYVGETIDYTAEELKNIEVALPKATVTEQNPVILEQDEYRVWNGVVSDKESEALVSGVGKLPLEVVVNFQAEDTLEECLAGGFAKWLVDFNITVEGLTNGSFVADNCYLAGNYGSYGWIKIPLDDQSISEGITYPVVALYDPTLNYKDICKSVKDFTAAIHIDQAILDANPNMTVKLELVMTNPDNADSTLQIGEDIIYTVAELENLKVAKNLQTGATYDSVDEALEAAAEGQTVVLLADVTEEEIMLRQNTILDLNGKTLTAGAIATINGADIIDSSDGKALIQIESEYLAIEEDNAYLPVWTEEGYRFTSIAFYQKARIEPDTNDNEATFVFWIDNKDVTSMLAQELADGGADNALQMQVVLTWTDASGNTTERVYAFADEMFANYVSIWEKAAYYLSVIGVEDVQSLVLEARIVAEITEKYSTAITGEGIVVKP